MHQRRVGILGGRRRGRLQQVERLWRQPVRDVWGEDKADTGKLGGNFQCSGTGNEEKRKELPRKAEVHVHESGCEIAGTFPPPVLAVRV